MRPFLAPVLCILVLTAPVLSQTTQPAVDSWTRTIQGVARAVEQADAAALSDILPPGATVHSLDRRISSASALLEATQGATPIAIHAYLVQPATLAADLARGIAASNAPDDLKRTFALADDQESQHANATAAQWIAEATGAKPRDPVGVIVCLGADGPAPGRLIFLIVRGQADTEGQCRIAAIHFGDPRQ